MKAPKYDYTHTILEVKYEKRVRLQNNFINGNYYEMTITYWMVTLLIKLQQREERKKMKEWK